MSRLYLQAQSDTRRTPVTATGHEEMEVEVLWGSVGDSNLAVRVEVIWPKGKAVPLVRFIPGPGVEVDG